MNRLAAETSPYLRQHAANPVDWYPWGEEAFARARAEDKPLLLSVGYSSCHWCHVMAHESFEDPEIAAVMNERFVNVKVDREERPDVDAVYMQAVQAMTGSGGWPMTVFLDADGRPFFGGTYFPSQDRPGMPGFVRVMDAVDEAWRERRADLLEQAGTLHDAIARSTEVPLRDAGDVSADVLGVAVAAVNAQFDPRFGGFGNAPKFPQAMTLAFMLSQAVRSPSPETLETITVSLDAMAAGGMYDQVGGGFHRYSVDAYWLVPALREDAVRPGAAHPRLSPRLARRRTPALPADRRGDHRVRAPRSASRRRRVLLRRRRRLRGRRRKVLPVVAGGDRGAERRRHRRARAVLRRHRRRQLRRPAHGYRGNILHVVDREEDRPEAVSAMLPRLLAGATTRARPGLDDKVLLGWNALFLRSLAEAAFALDRDDWMDAARTNARFLLRELRRDDGRLLRSWQGGRAHLLAYAEDYAALLEALITLAEVDDVAWLADARVVADDLVRLFADDENGGVFTTGVDGEALIVRPKDYQDNATPSENSLAANGLLRLAALTGDAAYEARASRWIRTMAPLLGEHPTAFAYLLEAFERLVTPPIEVAIVGEPGGADTEALRAELRRRLVPASVQVERGEQDRRRSHPTPRRSHRGRRAPPHTCASTTPASCPPPIRQPSACNSKPRWSRSVSAPTAAHAATRSDAGAEWSSPGAKQANRGIPVARATIIGCERRGRRPGPRPWPSRTR